MVKKGSNSFLKFLFFFVLYLLEFQLRAEMILWTSPQKIASNIIYVEWVNEPAQIVDSTTSVSKTYFINLDIHLFKVFHEL